MAKFVGNAVLPRRIQGLACTPAPAQPGRTCPEPRTTYL